MIAVFAALVTLLPIVTTAPSSGAQSKTMLSVHRGTGNSDRVDSFEKWLGTDVAMAKDFFGSTQPFSQWSDVSWVGNSHRGRRLMLSVAMFPPGETLEDAAAGKHRQHWKTLAKALAPSQPNAVISVGIEFNGNWFDWSIAGGREDLYVKAYRHAVDAMNEVSGHNFEYAWTVASTGTSGNVEKAYPGNAYVDYVAMDHYDSDWKYRPGDANWQARRWDRMLTKQWGLNWLADFAADKGKPIGFPEWGLVNFDPSKGNLAKNGGGDNPNYIEKMAGWINANNVAFHAYYDKKAGVNEHRLDYFPDGKSAYRRVFGNGKSGGSYTESSGSSSGGSSSGGDSSAGGGDQGDTAGGDDSGSSGSSGGGSGAAAPSGEYQWSFGPTTKSGWTQILGNDGWIADDGQRRQCGARNRESDPVYDSFCHAQVLYEKDNKGNWYSVDSPARWRATLPNGTYDVTVVVGEAQAHPSGIRHSVQAEGTPVFNKVTTTKSNPFRTATVTVNVNDGTLDLTFNGGTGTKIVAVTAIGA